MEILSFTKRQYQIDACENGIEVAHEDGGGPYIVSWDIIIHEFEQWSKGNREQLRTNTTT